MLLALLVFRLSLLWPLYICLAGAEMAWLVQLSRQIYYSQEIWQDMQVKIIPEPDDDLAVAFALNVKNSPEVLLTSCHDLMTWQQVKMEQNYFATLWTSPRTSESCAVIRPPPEPGPGMAASICFILCEDLPRPLRGIQLMEILMVLHSDRERRGRNEYSSTLKYLTCQGSRVANFSAGCERCEQPATPDTLRERLPGWISKGAFEGMYLTGGIPKAYYYPLISLIGPYFESNPQKKANFKRRVPPLPVQSAPHKLGSRHCHKTRILVT
ncbi:hypothetical protein BDR03DRAFT_1071892 [Suillus americanus]|nr:hypothetical protein BDR03DRAFT_1071892 [Suillus americanus]